MNNLKVNSGQVDGKASVSTPEEIDELVAQLSPACTFIALHDDERGYVQAALNAKYSQYDGSEIEGVAKYALECQATTNINHHTDTDDAEEIATFMKNWADDTGDWRSVIEGWQVLDFRSKQEREAAEADS